MEGDGGRGGGGEGNKRAPLHMRRIGALLLHAE